MTSAEVITAVEAELDQWCPGHWRKLSVEEMQPDPMPLFHCGWRVTLAEGTIRAPGVGHLLCAIDVAFPNSQPRIFAPELGSDFRWPHVEPNGLLCLRPTSIMAPPGDRARVHLDDAVELLNYSDAKCRTEFEREFGSYWSQQAIQPSGKLKVLSLVKPGGKSRQVAFHLDAQLGRIVVADTKAELKAWLVSLGVQVGDHFLWPALLVKLPRPWQPTEFPQTVGDTIRDLPMNVVQPMLVHNHRTLFLFEAETSTGPVFASVVATGDKSRRLRNGFRSWEQVPLDHVKRALSNQRVERVVVSRVDAPWIHGRGHYPDHTDLQGRKVVIVGCGAVGSEIAELLAKAGVGELTLIDSDTFLSANASRHLLGLGSLGWNKAQGVATELQRRLPHLKIGASYTKKFERLTAADLGKLAGVDMIVTAGLDIEGEAAVNAWRQSLNRPPAYLSTWVEAYAIVGHAVLLYGKDDLMSRFEGERPAFRLTDWPVGAGEVIVEAGCGNVFQPHGAADLQPTISMASKLALDALLGRVPASCRRVWFGDREAVEALGGVTRDDFTETNAMRQLTW
ncbi:ThiF family adenylyltransferase [Candidatus Accumulibacter sp. ACC007]|uniref:ThiF family adenylyltransferase n=1 Tax=Candidatus Accumulibacter sp. ACC007 TaxID=2823333 RepID=UPI0025B7AA71|nr:ThiF family adenylyltransferase [Candidatus Accumulibacter sp. ACC007]